MEEAEPSPMRVLHVGDDPDVGNSWLERHHDALSVGTEMSAAVVTVTFRRLERMSPTCR